MIVAWVARFLSLYVGLGCWLVFTPFRLYILIFKSLLKEIADIFIYFSAVFLIRITSKYNWRHSGKYWFPLWDSYQWEWSFSWYAWSTSSRTKKCDQHCWGQRLSSFNMLLSPYIYIILIFQYCFCIVCAMYNISITSTVQWRNM